MPGHWVNPNKNRKGDTARHVPGEGPVPCDIMLIGEGPGKEESWSGRPFWGAAGRLMDQFLRQEGLWRGAVYITNIVKYHVENDARPSAADIRRDAGELVEELARVQPKFVGLVGATAVHQFLPGVDLEWGHGMMFNRSNYKFIALYHPAYGLRSPEALPLVQDDFHWFAEMCKGNPAVPVWTPDAYPKPDYKEWKDDDAKEIRTWFSSSGRPIYVDTEGYYWLPWGLSVTDTAGWSRVIHKSSRRALRAFKDGLRNSNRLVYLHNSLHDIEVLAGGLEIEGYDFIDTMIQAYHLCIEPQGLKPLARRYAGMEMSSYEEIVRDADIKRMLTYLEKVKGWADKWQSRQSISASPASSKTSKRKAKKSKSASVGTKSQTMMKFPVSKTA